MTNIRIHGHLGKIFGSCIRIHLGRMSDFISAIDAVREGFRKKVLELSKQGHHYAYQIDPSGDLHVLPLIAGMGRSTLMVIAIIIIVIAIIAITIVTWGAGTAPAVAAALTSWGGVAATFALSVGISLLVSAINMKTGNTAGKSQEASTGGAASTIDAVGKSYVFSSNRNSATQGAPIPLGYGRMKVASHIIHAAVKSYSTSEFFNSVAETAETLTIPNLND